MHCPIADIRILRSSIKNVPRGSVDTILMCMRTSWNPDRATNSSKNNQQQPCACATPYSTMIISSYPSIKRSSTTINGGPAPSKTPSKTRTMLLTIPTSSVCKSIHSQTRPIEIDIIYSDWYFYGMTFMRWAIGWYYLCATYLLLCISHHDNNHPYSQ